MNFSEYQSPLGRIIIGTVNDRLTGLWFEGQRYAPAQITLSESTTEVLQLTRYWLDEYFAGRCPGFTPELAPQGTPFQHEVWRELLKIPYGKTITYGEIARNIGRPRAWQAVGAAVGHNPISLIIPCHRVVGADGSLTGYAGGLERKQALLELERKLNSVTRWLN